MRLFIAIDLPSEIKINLQDSQEKLKSSVRQARFTRDDNLHITLKFLGEVESSRTGDICSSLRQVTGDIKPFTLKIEGLGAFGSNSPLRVVWAGVSGDKKVLGLLQKKVDQALLPLGFPLEVRRFHPHITLARDVHPLDNRSWHDIELNFGDEFLVEKFSLFESVVENYRRVYRILETYHLNK